MVRADLPLLKITRGQLMHAAGLMADACCTEQTSLSLVAQKKLTGFGISHFPDSSFNLKYSPSNGPSCAFSAGWATPVDNIQLENDLRRCLLQSFHLLRHDADADSAHVLLPSAFCVNFLTALKGGRGSLP